MPAGGAALGPVGPTGKERNPIMVIVLTMVTCGIYGLIQFWAMLNELKAFRQKDDFSPVTSMLMLFVPILNYLELWKTGERVADAKRMAGIANPGSTHPILYIFLAAYFFPADLNEVWRAAGGPARE